MLKENFGMLNKPYNFQHILCITYDVTMLLQNCLVFLHSSCLVFSTGIFIFLNNCEKFARE